MLIQIVEPQTTTRNKITHWIRDNFPLFGSSSHSHFQKEQDYDCLILPYSLFISKDAKSAVTKILSDPTTTGVFTPVFVYNCPNQEAVAECFGLGCGEAMLTPLHLGVLRLRLEKLVRSTYPSLYASDTEAPFFMCDNHQMKMGATILQLRHKDFLLLHYLWIHQGSTLSRMQLLKAIWSEYHDVLESTVDSHIKSIRALITKWQIPARIITMYGKGYRLELKK